MNKAFTAAAIVLAMGFVRASNAQIIVDTSFITCKQLAVGFHGATLDHAANDARYLGRNDKDVTKYCEGHLSETLMDAIERTSK